MIARLYFLIHLFRSSPERLRGSLELWCRNYRIGPTKLPDFWGDRRTLLRFRLAESWRSILCLCLRSGVRRSRADWRSSLSSGRQNWDGTVRKSPFLYPVQSCGCYSLRNWVKTMLNPKKWAQFTFRELLKVRLNWHINKLSKHDTKIFNTQKINYHKHISTLF